LVVKGNTHLRKCNPRSLLGSFGGPCSPPPDSIADDDIKDLATGELVKYWAQHYDVQIRIFQRLCPGLAK
jgi:hypothetical protein